METQKDTVQLELRLSGSVAREAETCGLLRPEYLEPLLRAEIRRRRTHQLEVTAESPLTEPSTGRGQLIDELIAVLVETRQCFPDIQQRQFSFARFKTAVMDRLWEAYQDCGKYHRQLALVVRMAVRKLNSIELELGHIDALTSILRMLSHDNLTSDDATTGKKILHRSGIDVVTRFGEKTTELLRLYDDGFAET